MNIEEWRDKVVKDGQVYDACELTAENIHFLIPVMKAVTAKDGQDTRKLEAVLPSFMKDIYKDDSVYVKWSDDVPYYTNDTGHRVYMLVFGRSVEDSALMHATFPELKQEMEIARLVSKEIE